MDDYLKTLPPSAHKREIRLLQEEIRQELAKPKKGHLRFQEPYNRVSHLRARFLDFSGDVVTIGQAEELDEANREMVRNTLRAFMPWRKGPFRIFGIDIDAEWRSERKWSRLLPVLPDLRDKVIADVGCNNGYYMFRMAGHEPKLVIGFEPFLQHYYAFKTLNSFASLDFLHNELLGVEHIGHYERCFDVVFLMGILYHRKSPVEALQDVLTAMKPGGTLVVESQAIPGQDPIALFPEKTYAKVPGTFFVPTASCLENWLARAGFKDVEIFCTHPMSSEEQRRTDWMTFESYNDFIDPENPSRTVEGYPAPLRVYLKGVKK